MGDQCREHCGTRVLECAAEGPKIASERDAADLVNELQRSDGATR